MLKSALLRTLKDDFENYAAENRKISPMLFFMLPQTRIFGLFQYIAANVPFTYETKQRCLRKPTP